MKAHGKVLALQKNNAIKLAKYDWILNLDADEAIDDELKKIFSSMAT